MNFGVNIWLGEGGILGKWIETTICIERYATELNVNIDR